MEPTPSMSVADIFEESMPALTEGILEGLGIVFKAALPYIIFFGSIYILYLIIRYMIKKKRRSR